MDGADYFFAAPLFLGMSRSLVRFWPPSRETDSPLQGYEVEARSQNVYGNPLLALA